MKRKIVLLLLLILAGMWIFLSQDGWCRAKYPLRHDPWALILCPPPPENVPQIYKTMRTNTESPALINTSTLVIENVLRKGNKNLDNFKQK